MDKAEGMKGLKAKLEKGIDLNDNETKMLLPIQPQDVFGYDEKKRIESKYCLS